MERRGRTLTGARTGYVNYGFRDDHTGVGIRESIAGWIFVARVGVSPPSRVVIHYEKSEDGHEPIRRSLFAISGDLILRRGRFTIDTGKVKFIIIE